ncbi:hypothetical protein ACTXT7_001587 [Hymenolepis weldensis]
MSRSCSCTFLWGPNTSESAKDSIWSALKVHTELKIEVTFHKKSGISFNCLLDIVPIKNEKGQVVLFLVSHKDLTAQKATGIGASLLSCGLASTLGPAALVAKRQPQLEIPPGSQIPHRVVPIRRWHAIHPTMAIANCPTPPSTLSNRRSSAPHTLSNKSVRVRFGSEYGIPRDSPVKQKTSSPLSGSPNPDALTQPPRPLSPSSTLAPTSKSPTNYLSKKSGTQVSPKVETSTSSSSSSSSSKSSDSENAEASSTFKYQRRRSRAVLYHLSGRFDKKNKPGKLNFKCVFSVDYVEPLVKQIK